MSLQNSELNILKEEIESLKEQIKEKDQFCLNSRETFEKALMASPDSVLILDLDSYQIMEVNANFEEQFGFTSIEVRGKTLLQLNLWVNIKDRTSLTDLIDSNSVIKKFETEIRQKKGQISKILISAEKIISEGQNCLLVYLRSITELRKTENYYRLLAENSTDVIWIMGIDGKFTYISPSVYKLRGYKPEEVLKQSMTEVMTPASVQKVMILMKSFLEQEANGAPVTESVQTEIEQICKDGSKIWTEVIVTPLRGKDGQFAEILGVSRNIQGKKIAEQKTRQHTRTIEGIFRSAPIGIGLTKNRTFEMVNNQFCMMLGYSREEIIGKSARMIYSSDEEYERVGRIKYDKLRWDNTGDIYTTLKTKEGSLIDVLMSSSAIEPTDLSKGVVFNILDRSALNKAKATLDESETKYKEMFESSPEAMLLISALGVIKNCNAAFSDISGRPPEEVTGKHFIKTNLLLSAKLPEYMRIWARLLKEKKSQNIEFDWVDKNENTRLGLGHFTPIIEQNKLKGFQALLKDITHQKEFENNLIIAKEKAEESSRLKSAFLETMSHELRTPLNAVIGFSNLIETETNIDSIMEMNAYVTENGKKLLSIIESIFDISVLETRSAVLKTEEFSINEMFKELEITISGMIELENKTGISSFYQPGRRNQDLRITTDKQRLKQLLTNLLTNAIRYTDKGSIRYGYTQKNGNVNFFVADSGIGIPKDKLGMIFQKFTQVDSSPSRIRGGLGLGLSIADEISKLLGGEISLDSELGKGSTFSFSIAQKKSEAEISGNRKINLKHKTVLIVEDVESNYLYLEKLLTESGASVLWASTGHDAIAIAEKLDKIDLILMDIRMPDIDGYEITRKIKKMRSDIPIIAQTAYAMASDRKEALEAGCLDHISKPIKVDTLLEIVNKHIKAKAKPGLVL